MENKSQTDAQQPSITRPTDGRLRLQRIEDSVTRRAHRVDKRPSAAIIETELRAHFSRSGYKGSIEVATEWIDERVARCAVRGSHLEERRLIVKNLDTPRRASEAFAIMRYLRDNDFAPGAGDKIAVPEPIALLDERLLVMEEIFGVKATRLLRKGAIEGPVRLLARCLAKLHRSSVPLARTDPNLYWIRQIVTFCDRIEDGHPGFVREVRPLANMVLAGLQDLSFTPTPIHGDFHTGQVFVGDSVSWLLDTDSVRLGDPAKDIANFCVSLGQREGMTSDPGVASALFLAEYAAHAEDAPFERVPLHRALALLRRACKRLTDGEPTEELIQEAGRWPKTSRG